MPARLVQIYPYPRISNVSSVSSAEVARSSASSRLRLLRLSITDRCNFRCRYCMPAEGTPNVAHHDLLPLESLVELVRWLVVHSGIDRVRLTGGEPLLRTGVAHLIAGLSAIAGVREISLTTNGSLLPRMAWSLKAAGLNRVNVSLDSLNEQRFAEVTRGGSLKNTLAGIAAALEAGHACWNCSCVGSRAHSDQAEHCLAAVHMEAGGTVSAGLLCANRFRDSLHRINANGDGARLV